MSKKKADANLTLGATDKTTKAFSSVQRNMQNMASGAAAIEGPLGAVAGRINAIGAALGRMGPLQLGLIGSLASVTTVMYKSLTAGSEYEQQMLRIQKQIELTGASAGIVSEDIESMTRLLGEVTLASASAARQATSSLLAFDNIAGGVHSKILSLGQDLTAVMGGSLEKNVKNIARALDNPRQGLESLSRSVLSLDEATAKNIQTLFQSGRVLEAQGIIFDRLSEKVGGAGQGEAGGLAGKADTLGERWTNMLELLGSGDAGAKAGGILDAISNMFDKANSFLRTDKQNEILETRRSQLNQINEKYKQIEKTQNRSDINAKRKREIINAEIEDLKRLEKEQSNVLDQLITGRKAARLIAEAERLNRAAIASIERDELSYGKEQVKIAKDLNSEAIERLKIESENSRKAEEIYQASLTQEEKLNDLYVRRLITIENLTLKEIGDQKKKNKILLGLHERYLEGINLLNENNDKDNQGFSNIEDKLRRKQEEKDPQSKLDREFGEEFSIIALSSESEEEKAAMLLALQQQFFDDSDAIAEASAKKQAATREAISRMALSSARSLGDNLLEVLRRDGKEGTAIAKAIFLAQKSIDVVSIISATQVAAAKAAAFAATGGSLPFFATSKAILAFGYANAAIVAGLAIDTAITGSPPAPTESTPDSAGLGNQQFSGVFERTQEITIPIYLGGEKIDQLVIEGLVQAVNNDQIVVTTENGNERIIFANG